MNGEGSRKLARTMSTIDPRIFRAYDIRGRAHEQMSAQACRLVGHAFGTELRERTGKDSPRICIGRDARLHGPEFEEAVIEGVTAAGCEAVLIGQTPSPVNYFTVCTQTLDGGIHVTASHNPAEDNGLKLCISQAEAFSGEDLQELRTRIDRGAFAEDRKGRAIAFDGSQAYADHIGTLFEGAALGMRIVVDAGNGVAGPLFCEVLRRAGADVIELYTEPDGRFPNHPADPSKYETLRDLQATLLEHNAHVGLAFDGDGDRLGVIDERGAIRTADELLLLLAKDHLSRFPGAPVVFTVSNSGILASEIRSWRGNPVMCKVGHSHVEHTMREHRSMLGGEQSGHFFCGEEYFAFDDALVAALRVLSIVRRSDLPLSELCDQFPRVYQAPERRPFVPDEKKTAIIDEVTLHFQKTHDVLTLDGARIDFGSDGWAGIRQSNTSPCISICIEARTPEHLKEIEQAILGHLQTYPDIEWKTV